MTSTISRASRFAAACAMLATTIATVPAAQAQSATDDTQQLLTQIQTDKRAVVLEAMQLDDAQATAFTPIYDEYQRERKKLAEEGLTVINSYAANYDSMTDDAAAKLLKSWMEHEDNKNALTKKYVKRFEKVLPATKLLRFVQVENKLNTVLSLPAIQAIPLAK
jgi:DNA-binding sugar fermentation-stimulating protein